MVLLVFLIGFISFVTILIISVIWWYIELYKCNKYLAKYPGPPPVPLIGNGHYFTSSTSVISVATKLHQEYGTILKVMLLHRPRLVMIDPKPIEFLLTSNTILSKSYEYRYSEPWFGKGLLTSIAAEWRDQRKLINPTFHYKNLHKFLSAFNSQTDILIDKLSNQVENSPFDIFPEVSLCTLDIICEAVMGTVVGAQSNSEYGYMHSSKQLLRIVMDRIISPTKMWDFLYWFSKDYQKEKAALKVLRDYGNSIIKNRRRELAEIENSTKDDDDIGVKKALVMLDFLLQCTFDGKPLTDQIIRDHVNTLVFAGHDTSASGISFSLYCLSRNPDIQQKVLEELKNILSDDPFKTITYKDLQKMKYLEMVIKESLRLYPTVPFIARILEENVEYNGGILPKGLSLCVFIFGLHRNPEFYPNPNKFDPERFSPENSAGRPHYAYIPFSAGIRNCLGQKFAMLEMKVIISKILMNFELLPVPEHTPVLLSEIVLKSANGVVVMLKKRKL